MKRIDMIRGLLHLILIPATPCVAGDDVGPLVRSLWLVHRHGTDESVQPRSDQKTKGSLSKALGRDGTISAAGAQGLMDPTTFARLAGDDAELDPNEVRKILETDVPDSRKLLNPRVVAHADLLTTSFDLIDGPHNEAGELLVEWLVRSYRPGQPMHVTVICTGNSRRSILGATMGNIAAAYYGMPEIRFHSGGTDPTAFNPRTIAALREIGVEVEPTGSEAPRGEPTTANPVYTIRWGSGLEATEYSKNYLDSSNPKQGFAALMVCGEADSGCPVVKGAATRISMPYLDPKIYDGSAYESQKYGERRDDIGRMLLCVMMQARHRLNQPSQ